VCDTLHQCELNRVNAFQYTHLERGLSDLERHRASGGNMLLIGTDTSKDPVEETVKRIQPVALYHRGEKTDVLFRTGKMHQVQEYTKRLRQTGMLVGIGTHKTEVIEYVEERGWNVDFQDGFREHQAQRLRGDWDVSAL
jgi:chromosome condensin MukBEF MukE localization factor